VFKKYLALLRQSLAALFEYRANMLIWMLINVMPLVMLAVWFSMSEGGPIAGYTQSDFVSYYLLLALVQQMTTVWVIYELDYEIRHGDLSIKLLHPLNPLHDYLATNLADKILRPFALIPLALLAWMIFPTIHYDIAPLNVILFVVALAGAWFIRFIAQYIFGLLAFWVSDSMTLNDIWYGLSQMLGGMIAPLTLFPSNVTAIANWLPFRFMLSFPVEIASGRLTRADLAMGIAAMLFWVGVGIVVYRWVWRRGIRRFSAFGA
jgi:ABC-2 type transport system permease protein